MEEHKSEDLPKADSKVPLTSNRSSQSRKRKKPSRFAPISEERRRTAWTEDEKRQLLDKVKIHGWKNTSVIASALPSRTEEEIKSFLGQKYLQWKKTFVKEKPGLKKAPIEIWLEKCEKLSSKKPPYSRALVKVFRLMSQAQEEKPCTVFEPDYQELYVFFHKLLHGEFPADLRPANNVIVLQLLETMAVILKSCPWDVEREYLSAKFESLRNSVCKEEKEVNKEQDHQESANFPDFEEVKNLLFTGKRDRISVNPFNLEFGLVSNASAKVQQVLENQS